jgi:SH3-like domain-containing protein
MKKSAILLVIAALLAQSGVALAADFQPGSYTASQNLNVRSVPNVHGGSLIDHYNKGASVKVVKVMGSWCKVELKNYQRAYVYCPILNNGTVSMASPEQKDTAALQSLRDVKTWLLKDDESGKKYVNDSLDMGTSASIQWSKGAYMAEANLNFYADGSNSCKFEFDSAQKPGEVYQSKCMPKQASQAVGVAAKGDGGKKPVNDPPLKVTNMIGQILDSAEWTAKINQTFASVAQTKADIMFKLLGDENNNGVWTMTMKAGNVTLTASSPADSTTAKLTFK